MHTKLSTLFEIPVAKFNWQNHHHIFDNMSPIMHQWLYETGSLTQRAINYCRKNKSNFNVKVLKHDYGLPEQSEMKILNLQAEQECLIREVLLNCNQTAIIYARTVIPQSTMIGKHEQLRLLGNKPLGEYLFSQDDMIRGPLEISSYKNSTNQNHYWARRSLFYLQKNPLLVYEIFLQSMKTYDKTCY
ncbi:MAG: chorismate lyase [Gammaproteobacteria bacterium]|nr:chorismate lyase [Gammaproteobacteria bacterium]